MDNEGGGGGGGRVSFCPFIRDENLTLTILKPAFVFAMADGCPERNSLIEGI